MSVHTKFRDGHVRDAEPTTSMEGQSVEDREQLIAVRFENSELWLVLVESEEYVENRF